MPSSWSTPSCTMPSNDASGPPMRISSACPAAGNVAFLRKQCCRAPGSKQYCAGASWLLGLSVALPRFATCLQDLMTWCDHSSASVRHELTLLEMARHAASSPGQRSQRWTTSPPFSGPAMVINVEILLSRGHQALLQSHPRPSSSGSRGPLGRDPGRDLPSSPAYRRGQGSSSSA